MHTVQIHWNGPNRADAIQTELQTELAADLLEPRQVVEYSSRGLAVHCPNPTQLWRAGNSLTNLPRIKHPAPIQPQDVKVQAEAACVIHQSIAKFSVGENQTRLFQQGNLPGCHIVSQAARSEKNLDRAGVHQFA